MHRKSEKKGVNQMFLEHALTNLLQIKTRDRRNFIPIINKERSGSTRKRASVGILIGVTTYIKNILYTQINIDLLYFVIKNLPLLNSTGYCHVMEEKNNKLLHQVTDDK